MKTLYLDIFSGISGDMFIGALIDLGVDFHKLEHELEKLDLDGFHLHATRAHKAAIEGVKFDVHLPHTHKHSHEHTHDDGLTRTHEHSHHDHHRGAHEHGAHEHHGHDEEHEEGHGHDHGRNYAEIRDLISGSKLSAWVKQKAMAVFHRIAVAEGKIHGRPADDVHFHEVGAVDSIVDIVGACIGLEMLGKPRVLAGNVMEGTGFIHCAHGRFPIPAPATLAILGARGVAVSQCDEPHELVTPTGAALLAELVEVFGPMRGLVAEKIGYGLGTRDNKTRPNVLRAVFGESKAGAADRSQHDWETDTIAVLETNLDDVNAEILGSLVERALTEGALDVFFIPIQMKKNRPAVMLTVLCVETDADKFIEFLLRETSAFGVRRHSAERRKLIREFVKVQTPYAEVTIKLGKLDGKILQAAPEFESCREAAESSRVPLKQVYEAALKAFKDPGSRG